MQETLPHPAFGDVVYVEAEQPTGGVRALRIETLQDRRAAAGHITGQLSLFGAAGGFATEPGVDRAFDPWGGLTYTHDQPPFRQPMGETTD